MNLVGNIFTRHRVTNFLTRIHRSAKMVHEASNCILEPISPDIKPVTLPHGEVVSVGRSPHTLINDSAVSRKQITLKANYHDEVVQCVLCGTNRSGCNGYALKNDVMYTFKHGDRIEMILGKYRYKIVFQSLKSDEESPGKKLKVASSHQPVYRNISITAEIKGTWDNADDSLFVYTPTIPLSGNRVASFDLDGTLIKTKSGQRFPKDGKDWVFAFGNIKEKLKELFLQGFRVVIFTNQMGLHAKKQKIPEFKEKVSTIISKLGIPVHAFVAIQKDIYRKPCPGMWNAFLKRCAEEVNIDESFFVGDAAGRKNKWAPHKTKDHSTADRLFALNLNMKFYTPEEYFLGAKAVPFEMPEFDPRNVPTIHHPIPLLSGQEVILMVGSPGSGKSHFCKTNVVPFGYTYINRDILGNQQKCLKLMEEALKEKKSVVVDNTNPDVRSRSAYLELCKRYAVSCKCFHMDTPVKHCKHNIRFRDLVDTKHSKVNEILINMHMKNFQKPSVDEGFDHVYTFQFNAAFENEKNEKLYKMFLLES